LYKETVIIYMCVFIYLFIYFILLFFYNFYFIEKKKKKKKIILYYYIIIFKIINFIIFDNINNINDLIYILVMVLHI